MNKRTTKTKKKGTNRTLAVLRFKTAIVLLDNINVNVRIERI